MQVTYYPCARRMRAGRKGLVREVRQSRQPEMAARFEFQDGIDLSTLIKEFAKVHTVFAVQLWINGAVRVEPNEMTRKMIVPIDQNVILIQDLSGDAFRGLGWIVCADSEEDTEAA